MDSFNSEFNAFDNGYSNDSDNPEIFSVTESFYQSYNEIPFKYEPYEKENYLLNPTLDDIVNAFTSPSKTEEKNKEPTIVEKEHYERTIIQTITDKNEPIDEKTENPKIENDENNNNNEKNINNDSVINNKDNNNKYKVYNLEEIINILKRNKISSSIINKINKDIIKKEDTDNINPFEIRNKIKKSKYPSNNNDDDKEKDKKKGRKTLTDNIKGNHKKDSPDNIIKKCKGIFCTSVIEYIEIFLNKYKKNYEGKIKLLTLDYSQYVNRLKKEIDLELLDKPLKNIASLDTSKRYHRINDTYWNKKIIDKIIVKEKDNKEINDLLNMSFNEWIDIFTYKKDWEYNINCNGFKFNLEKIADDDDNDEEYFSRFIFYLYNYKRWFMNKKGRNRN
mgnify:CR=1 FL=1